MPRAMTRTPHQKKRKPVVIEMKVHKPAVPAVIDDVVPKKRGPPSQEEQSLTLRKEDVLSEKEKDFFDGVGEATMDKTDNPFIELRSLINGSGIDTKTILTQEQVVHMHKLDMLEEFFKEDEEAFELLNRFKGTYMRYIINKDGTSRKQFIEALQRGAEKAEQANANRTLKGLLPAV